MSTPSYSTVSVSTPVLLSMLFSEDFEKLLGLETVDFWSICEGKNISGIVVPDDRAEDVCLKIADWQFAHFWIRKHPRILKSRPHLHLNKKR